MSHTRERRRAKRSGGKESGEEAPRKSLSHLAASPLDFAHAATPRALVLQHEPARRLDETWNEIMIRINVYSALTVMANYPGPRQ